MWIRNNYKLQNKVHMYPLFGMQITNTNRVYSLQIIRKIYTELNPTHKVYLASRKQR